MNYIKQLQKQIIKKEKRLRILDEGMVDILRYVNLPKFQGIDTAGNFKNYVNTSDIISRINEIRMNGEF